MKVSVALAFLAVLPFTRLLHAAAQNNPVNPYASACGANPVNYSVKHAGLFSPQPAPSGKSLVYIIENMPANIPFLTEKVNLGLDGSWLGATEGSTYTSFIVNPGVHHLCAVYQGKAYQMTDQDQTLLLHLNAELGKTYYLRYQAYFFKNEGGIAIFEPVDEDEALYLLQYSELAASRLKK